MIILALVKRAQFVTAAMDGKRNSAVLCASGKAMTIALNATLGIFEESEKRQ